MFSQATLSVLGVIEKVEPVGQKFLYRDLGFREEG